ncbi:hypothetical protein B0T22DRAFT_521651 [Podospora appendiculata]|uniref:Fungal-type protein kinase domain-containing protein n=1 Tax=Podospora appendiculata TaxID=314037 RepID=A0AAE1C807_9PEZI|nr:hypothetical protein B0T22DRAFT_521651 [Podospora appendiculata]
MAYFDLDRIKSLLQSAIPDDDDALIWKEVYKAVIKPTPPPQPIASSLQRTPWLHNTSSFANSFEYRKDVDRVLKDELGVITWQYPERGEEGELLYEVTSKGVINIASASLPHGKRACSVSPVKAGGDLSNRVHRRVILRDYGNPIYKASSRTSLLAALDGCIEGHESPRKAGILHRDIPVNNPPINEDDNNPSWLSLLIDSRH